jgi:hypothetical protein
MRRNAWCFGMMLGAGGCLGTLLGLINPLGAYLASAALILISLRAVMRIDDDEFWCRLRAGKD